MSFSTDGVKFTRHPRKANLFFGFFVKITEAVLSVLFIITLAAPFGFPNQAHAVPVLGVSKKLSYQGRLTDASGNPLTGTYCVRFSLWDVGTGGTRNPDQLWPAAFAVPTSNSVVVTNGVFNVGIGIADDLSTFDFSSNDTQFLYVEVNNAVTTCSGGWEALSPYQNVYATAYARVAENVYGGNVRVGTGTGSGTPKLLSLDWKNTTDYIGDTCSINGTIWFNSGSSRGLICESLHLKALSNATSTLDAVVPAGNLSVAATAITNGTVTLAGGNNITLSQAGNAVTVLAGYNAAQFTNSTANNTMNLVWAGNSNGSGNLTFGLTGSTVTGSAPSGGGGGTFGMSNLGISTAGTSGTVGSQFIVVGGAGIIGSQSINGQSATLSMVNSWSTATTASQITNSNVVGANAGRFALEGHQHAGVAAGGISGGNTLNTSGTYYGSLMFAGGNNITLSAVTEAGGQTITIFGGAGGGGAAFSAGTQSVNTGTVNFANSNNIVFGMSNSNQITASAAFGGVAGSAASTVTNGVVQFSNLNGVSFGLNGSTMTASIAAGAGVTLTRWEPYVFASNTSASSIAPASSYFQTIILPAAVAISRVNLIKSFNFGVPTATSAASTGSQAYSFSQGFSVFRRVDYAANSSQITQFTTASAGMTFNLGYSSTSQTIGASWVTNSTGGTSNWSTSSNAGNYSSYWTGLKIFRIPLVTTLTAGEYWIGYGNSSTSATSNSNIAIVSLSQAGMNFAANTLGNFAIAGSISSYGIGGQGVGSASAAGVVTNNTMAISNISQVSSTAQINQYFNFNNF